MWSRVSLWCGLQDVVTRVSVRLQELKAMMGRAAAAAHCSARQRERAAQDRPAAAAAAASSCGVQTVVQGASYAHLDKDVFWFAAQGKGQIQSGNMLTCPASAKTGEELVL